MSRTFEISSVFLKLSCNSKFKLKLKVYSLEYSWVLSNSLVESAVETGMGEI